MESNNFLAPEPFIVERLKQALAGRKPAVHVLTAADLSDLKEEAQPTPAVHVVWSGFRVEESRFDGTISRLEHTWLIVTAVRNARGLREGAAARADAGLLMASVGAAVMGFRPAVAGVTGHMRLAPSPAAHFASGFMYLPLAFFLSSNFKAAA